MHQLKMQRLAECITKHDPAMCCLKETRFKFNNIGRLKQIDGKRHNM